MQKNIAQLNVQENVSMSGTSENNNEKVTNSIYATSNNSNL